MKSLADLLFSAIPKQSISRADKAVVATWERSNV